MPEPDTSSAFTVWSGDCSGSGTCLVSMTVNHAATATFSLIARTRVGTIPYGTLASAYAAVPGGGLLEAQALTFIENLVLNRSVAFTLKGGYAADYLSRPGLTSLDGVLTIGSGAVTVDGLIIK